MDTQENDLLISWQKLSEENRRNLTAYVKFLLKKQDPDYQKEIGIERELFFSQLKDVRSIEEDIKQVVIDIRSEVYKRLPKELADLFIDLEIVLVYQELAAKNPASMFGKENIYRKHAIRSMRRARAKIARLSSQPV